MTEIAQIFWLPFFLGKKIIFDKKMCWATFWAIFFSYSSGRRGWSVGLYSAQEKWFDWFVPSIKNPLFGNFLIGQI
jgi:hypothetical protein